MYVNERECFISRREQKESLRICLNIWGTLQLTMFEEAIEYTSFVGTPSTRTGRQRQRNQRQQERKREKKPKRDNKEASQERQNMYKRIKPPNMYI